MENDLLFTNGNVHCDWDTLEACDFATHLVYLKPATRNSPGSCFILYELPTIKFSDKV